MKYIPIGVLGLVVLGASTLTGQVIYNSASTAAEGAANGMSNIISAQGQKNLSDSQAAINLTQARSAQINNQVDSVNAFWEKKGIYNEHQQQQLSAINAKRDAYLANHGLGTLTPQEFDRTTGTIMWPKVLDQSDYAKYRTTLDELFKKRAYAGALTGDEYMEATAANKEWRAMITSQKNVYPAPIITQMLQFILRLNREMNDNLG